MSTHRQTQITAKHPLIAIEGGIGAGKSTLGRWIRRNTSGHYVDEYMSPMLPSYFVDPHRYALAVQVDSIVQRTRLLKAAHDVRHIGPIWLDRSIYGDLAFARANHAVGRLDAHEYSVFVELYDVLTETLTPPTDVLWLNTSLDVCADRRAKRSRSGEALSTDHEYTEALEAAYIDVLADASSHGVTVHHVDWSVDLSGAGAYHSAADQLVTRIIEHGGGH